ncbi:MAG: DUF4149 domain-containing protein [Nitrospirota bacterium]|nr:DUF4149 domain-containing protein [Nitrospirota bacterium]
MASLIEYLHALAIAILVGKVVLLSFVVAPILAKSLEREQFGMVVRRLFPAYYALGMGTAIMGLVSLSALAMIRGTSPSLLVGGGVWLIILAAESYCRSPLTPQSNEMRDRLKKQEQRGAVDPNLQAAWNRLHQRSVYLNSLVLLAGLCLLGLAHQL